MSAVGTVDVRKKKRDLATYKFDTSTYIILPTISFGNAGKKGATPKLAKVASKKKRGSSHA